MWEESDASFGPTLRPGAVLRNSPVPDLRNLGNFPVFRPRLTKQKLTQFDRQHRVIPGTTPRFLSPLDTDIAMRAYYFDNIPGDQRLPHDSSRPVSTETLDSIGLLHWQIPLQGNEAKIDQVASERGYKNRDTISVTKEGLGDVGTS